MRNPLETEDAAFRFVLGTIAFVVPVVLAAWIAAWLGLVVLVGACAVTVVILRRGREPAPPPSEPDRADVEDTP